MAWRAIEAKIPFSIYVFLKLLGASRIGFTELLEMQLVEYLRPNEMRYLPAFAGRWYRLQTNRQSLNSLKDSRVSRMMSMNL